MNHLLRLISLCLIPFCSQHAFAKTEHINWWNESTFYQIFPRSFQDSNGDGVGDLRGVVSRLDYLNDGGSDLSSNSQSLGIKGIWLTPIFPSPSYHGYDATNFYSIDPQYGSLEDFRLLVQGAHKRGIKIVLDLAINFTSDRHPWFVEAKSSPTSRYRDWYLWRKSPPQWGTWYKHGDEYFYSVFHWTMPHLNWQNPAVLEEFKNVMRFWMLQGADGFRMDAARYYVPGPNGEADTSGTHAVLARLSEALKAEFPEAILVGEVWAPDTYTISTYTRGGELDLAFNFPVAFAYDHSLNPQDTNRIVHELKELNLNFNDVRSNAPFLSNHDTDRLASRLWSYQPKMKLAAEINFLLPGTPFVYYGEELGYPNGSDNGDWAKRKPMQWTPDVGFGFTQPGVSPWQPFLGGGLNVASQSQIPDSLFNLYRTLIHFRNRTPVIAHGSLGQIIGLHQDNLILWTREWRGQRAIVAANLSHLSSREIDIPVEFGAFARIKQRLYRREQNIQSCECDAVGHRDRLPSMQPHSVQAFLLEE